MVTYGVVKLIQVIGKIMSGVAIRRIVNDSIIMYFDAAKSSSNVDSTTFLDLSKSSGKTGFVNSPVYNSLGGGSYNFNGSNQYMDVTYSQLNVPYDGKTIIVCAYLATNFNSGLQSAPNYGFRNLFGKPNSTGNQLGRNWNFYVYDDNTNNGYQYHFSSYNSAGLSGYLPKTGLNQVVQGSWIVAAFTQDSSGLCSFYHNGLVTATYSGQLQQYISHPSDGERIGAQGTGASGYNSGGFWKGNISTVLIYNRGLTADEIKQNYNVYRYRYNLPQN
jgi:hypothetical protein